MAGCPVPGHKFIPPRRGPVAGDLGDDIGNVGLRLNAVEFGCLYDSVDGGGAIAASLRSGEQPILAAQSHTAHRAFGYVVVDLQTAIFEKTCQCDPAFAAIGDRLGHLGFGREASQGIVECRLQFLDQWRSTILPASSPDIGLLAANLCFDLIKLANALQQIGGQRCRLGGMDIKYLAAKMRPASDLGDAAGVVELVITGIAVGLEIAGKVRELALGMRAGAIGGELIPDQ